jgi:O-antigen/teichoic acid export membrane protein
MARVEVKSLLRSSGVAGVASFWQIAAGIFLTPLVLAAIGLEGYGVWALLHGISQSMSGVSGSMNLAYAKLTAEYGAKGRHGELAGLLGSGVLMIGAACGLGAGAIWAFRFPVLETLGVPDEMIVDAALALGLVLAGLFLRLSLGCYRQILAGLQRTDLQYQARILSSATYFGVAIMLLGQGQGLPGLAAAFLAGEVAAAVLAWFWVRRLEPTLRVRLLSASHAGMKKFLLLGGRFQLLRFMDQTSTYGARMLMSALLGPAALGTFELGRKLIRLGLTGSRAIMAPMMPAFAALHASRDEERARFLYREGSRLLFVASLICFTFLCIFADRALRLWTGETHPLAVWVVRVLALGYMVRPLTGMGTASMRGRGRVGLEVRTGLAGNLLRFTILYPFFVLWGFQGFVASGAVSGAVVSLSFVWLYSRAEGIPLGSHLHAVVVRPVMVFLPVAAAAVAIEHWVHFAIPGFSQRWNILLELGLAGGLYVAIAGAALWFGLLDGDERQSIGDRVRRLTGGAPPSAQPAATR